MRSFQKYVGSPPTNMATGAARPGLGLGLGLRSAALTRVGDEHMGRSLANNSFARERMFAVS